MKALVSMAGAFAGLAGLAGLASLVVAVVAAAIAPMAPQSDVPLLTDGTVNLGQVPGEDGVWELNYIENFANYVVPTAGYRSTNSRRHGRGSAGEPQVPFLPWTAAVYDYNTRNEAKYDPAGYCLPPGGPRLFTSPYPMTIIQVPEQKRVFFHFEAFRIWREVYMDGRPHELRKNGRSGIKGSWLGHSVGRYEDGGKTLVIDVVGFNEGTWLDSAGHPHTDQLHVVEKFTRPGKRQLRYEALIDDPGAYSRPWTVSWAMSWWPGGQLDEYVCNENNQFIKTLKDDFGVPVLSR
jgi:hypothetical protein